MGKKKLYPPQWELKYKPCIRWLCYKWVQPVQVCLGRRKPEDELVGLTQAIYFLETLCLCLDFAHKPYRELCISWSPDTRSGPARGAVVVTRGGFISEGGELLWKGACKQLLQLWLPLDKIPENVFEGFQKI